MSASAVTSETVAAQLRQLPGDDYENIVRALIQLVCEPRGFRDFDECAQKVLVTVRELITVLQVALQYARAREREAAMKAAMELCMREDWD